VEKIYLHIEKLLAQHDYVIVPDLGGFVVQKQSAQCLKDRITPPTYSIAFNPLMQHTDGLLVIEIARFNKISYRSASELLEKNILELKQTLSKNKTLEFGQLGTLVMDNDLSIIFNPTPHASFLPLNFGLSPVYTSPKNRKPTNNTITLNTPSFQWQKLSAAAILIFGLLFVTPSADDSRNINTADLTSFIKANIEKERALMLTQKSDSIVSSTDSVASEVTSPKVVPMAAATTSSKLFHVIVGSWAGEKSASKHCQMLKDENFKDVHVVHPQKGYHIAIKSFETKEEAVEFMKNVRKSEKRFSSAWVLCEDKFKS
jgi:nucleoid DNA-binding protein